MDEEPDSPELTVLSVERINREEVFASYGFRVFLSHPLHGTPDAAFLAGCRVSVSNVTVSSCEYDPASQALVLYLSADVRRTLGITITIPMHRRFWYYRHQNQKWFLPALTAVVEPEVITYNGYTDETASIQTITSAAWIDEAVFHTFYDEHSAASIVVSTAQMSLKPVSTLPI
jgi:hypothetical protein